MRYPFEEQSDWVLVRGLGEGTVGSSFLVEGTMPPVEQAVIKLCAPLSRVAHERLKLEIEALGRLKHPGLVPWRGVLWDGDQVGLVRSWAEGTGIAPWVTLVRQVQAQELGADSSQDELLTLESRRISEQLAGLAEDTDEIGAIVAEMALKERAPRRAPLEEILTRLKAILPSLLDALEQLHRYRKVHGGLHMQNILINDQGQCLLMDYGIWPMVLTMEGADASLAPLNTARQAAIKTQAPEVFKPDGGFTLASDVYSLGCVLYELLANKPPFEGTAQEIARGHMHEAIPSLLEACPGCPSEWAELVDAMLTKHPDRRATLAQVRAQLHRCSTRVASVPPTYLPAPAKLCGRFEVVDAIMDGARVALERRQMRAIVIEAESGLGKNHLAEQACWRLAQRGWVVLRSTCYADEVVPYQSWLGFASGLGELLDRCPAPLQQQLKGEREVAASMLPGLLPAGQAPASTTLHRGSALRALLNLLGRLAEERPVVVCLENAHIASEDSRELLLDLCASRGDLPCVVLSTWGPGHGRAYEVMGAERVVVRAMTREEARRFLRSFAQGEALDALEPLIALREHHQPLVLKELLYELHRAGDAKQRATLLGDLMRPDHDGSAQPARTRAALKRAFRERVERLGAVERLLIQALAVHAGPMSLDMLRKLPEAMSEALEPSQTLEGLMTRLCMMRLSKRLQARRDVLPSYRISHEICRKVVLEGVSPERRRALLIAIAGAVPDGPEAASRRFALLAAAEADEEAAQHAEEALMWARSRLASSQAAKIRRWVLERTQEQGASYTAKIRELAQLEATSGRFHEAAEQWHQLGEAAHASQSSATASALWLEEGRMWLRAGELANARAALARAEGAIAQRLHRSPTARLSALWRSWSSSATRRQQALQRRDVVLSAEVQTASRLEALALRLDPLVSGGRGARRREELEVLGWEHHSPALLARAWAMGLERLLERDFARAMHEGDAVLGEIVAYQRRQRDNAGLLFGLTLRGRLHHLAGEYSEAAATWREARQVAAEVTATDQMERAEFLFWRAAYHLDIGKIAQVEEALARLMHEERHIVMASLYGHRLGVKLRLLEGRLRLVEQHLTALQETLGEQSMGSLWGAWWSRHMARLQLALGRPEVASGQLEMAWEALQTSGLARWPLVALQHQLALGQALAAQAERELALQEEWVAHTQARLKRALHQIGRRLDDAPPLLAAEALRLMARHALMRGKPQRALRLLDEAVVRMGRVPSPLAQACCLEARGRAMEAMEREEGARLIQQARQVYDHYRVIAPLILEGWPAPRELVSLQGVDS